MIEAENLKKGFVRSDGKRQKHSFFAVDDVSIRAGEGEAVGILGANGAGKTTLLRMLAGIMQPDGGEICVDSMGYSANEIEIKKRLAFLSGNTRLYGRVTPIELMKMCGELYEVEKRTADERIEEICLVLQLNEFRNSRIASLSTGQTQRVGIARCLVHSPKYYIFDEVTAGLDIMSAQVILDFIRSEKEKGKGIIYSTHYMEEAEKICDRVVMLNRGRVIAAGTPAEICEKTGESGLREAFFSLLGGDGE